MWLDCNTVLINVDHVDYISFEALEEGYKAIVYFENGDSLDFTHADLDALKSYFKKVVECGEK